LLLARDASDGRLEDPRWRGGWEGVYRTSNTARAKESRMRMTKMMMSGILAAAMVGCGGMDESQTDTELGQAAGAATVHTFGVHATDAYEANWQDALTGFQWDMTSRFINQLAKTDTNKFYYNLQGKASYWHDTGDHAVNSLEDVEQRLGRVVAPDAAR
jgi:hypothetical protein